MCTKGTSVCALSYAILHPLIETGIFPHFTAVTKNNVLRHIKRSTSVSSISNGHIIDNYVRQLKLAETAKGKVLGEAPVVLTKIGHLPRLLAWPSYV